jgi:hypothetical protein
MKELLGVVDTRLRINETTTATIVVTLSAGDQL